MATAAIVLVRAKYPFDGSNEEEMRNVQEGDEFALLENLGEWCFVRSETSGEEGYIPTTYVSGLPGEAAAEADALDPFPRSEADYSIFASEAPPLPPGMKEADPISDEDFEARLARLVNGDPDEDDARLPTPAVEDESLAARFASLFEDSQPSAAAFVSSNNAALEESPFDQFDQFPSASVIPPASPQADPCMPPPPYAALSTFEPHELGEESSQAHVELRRDPALDVSAMRLRLESLKSKFESQLKETALPTERPRESRTTPATQAATNSSYDEQVSSKRTSLRAPSAVDEEPPLPPRSSPNKTAPRAPLNDDDGPELPPRRVSSGAQRSKGDNVEPYFAQQAKLNTSSAASNHQLPSVAVPRPLSGPDPSEEDDGPALPPRIISAKRVSSTITSHASSTSSNAHDPRLDHQEAVQEAAEALRRNRLSLERASLPSNLKVPPPVPSTSAHFGQNKSQQPAGVNYLKLAKDMEDKGAMAWNHGKLPGAYDYYARSLGYLRQVLLHDQVGTSLLSSVVKEMARVDGILCRSALSKLEKRYPDRPIVLQLMCKHGFDAKSCSRELALDAQQFEAEGQTSSALLMYEYAIECLLAYHRAMVELQRPTEPEVRVSLNSLLQRAEAIKVHRALP